MFFIKKKIKRNFSRTGENKSLMSLFQENISLNKYSRRLIVLTNMFALELSKCNKLSK